MTVQTPNTAELIKAAETALEVLNEARLERSLSPDEEHARDLLQDAVENSWGRV